jgi:SAM-dependent methyltransferase
MAYYILEKLATADNFDEEDYLRANSDVAAAVQTGSVESGRAHFMHFGHREGRRLRHGLAVIRSAKQEKLRRLRPLLRTDLPCVETETAFNFLSEEFKKEFNIVETSAVSGHPYENSVMALIEQYSHGLLLDCGAGRRPVYFDNVVNFEIVPYDTTDVLGVGEELPFRDASFDAVISIAVLEHVKDPFRCAREIIRVLKPGGQLLCSVPFLQPLHGYPHHYYNMTHQGLKNLFDHTLTIDRLEVFENTLPIWTLTWILQSWAAGLTSTAKEEFLNLKIADLLQEPQVYLERSFVRNLSREKNLELASACTIFAHKSPS